MNARILNITLLTTLFFFCGQFLYAQDATAAVPVPPTCDQVLSGAKTAMQKEADATCKSVTRCISCLDAKSSQLLYITMIISPNCQSTGTRPAAKAQAERAAAAADTSEEPPVFEILQERCENGTGVNLRAYIPGDVMRCGNDRYAFLWEIDEGKGGHASQIECACGSIAQLTVTDIKTGLSQSKKVELMPCRR